MEAQRKRIKRAEVSSETRSGRYRAAVNPNANRPTANRDAVAEDADKRPSGRADGRGGDAS